MKDGICDGTEQEIADMLNRALYVDSCVVCGIIVLCGLVSVTSTMYIFVWRSKEERPGYVIFQSIFINMHWVLFIAYFSIFIYRVGNSENKDEAKQVQNELNIWAAFADFCFITHDWIFTDQYL